MAIAAFFDVDGTLLARNSAPLYMSHLRRTGQARRRDLALTFYYFVRYRLGVLDLQAALDASMTFVRGRSEVAMERDCNEWYARVVRPLVYPAMAALVNEHRAAGHVPALLTSATRYLAEPLAADLGIEHCLVTRLVVEDGVFTGEVERPVCYGSGKMKWVERFAAGHAIDLGTSYFYTDSITDLPVLEQVGHPRVVHPDPRLRRVAQQRGWPLLRPRLDEVGHEQTTLMLAE